LKQIRPGIVARIRDPKSRILFDMPRIDDYLSARQLARDKLAVESFEILLGRSGFEPAEGRAFRIPFLNRIYRLGYPEFEFSDMAADAKDVPLQEQIIILHYLLADSPDMPGGDWVAYREVPGATFYFSAFAQRALEPLKKVFGQNLTGFRAAAAQLNAAPVEFGDAACEFQVLPKVPIRLILHSGDEEFPAEANILFDRSIGRQLSPEDIAWLAGMLVYRLILLSKS
jgi:hypothetical protein